MLKSIKRKILFAVFLLCIFPMAFFILWEYNRNVENLKSRSFEQLKTVREIKRREIEWYFNKLNDYAKFFSQSSVVVNAMQDFEAAYFNVEKQHLSPNFQNYINIYYADFRKKLGADSSTVDVLRIRPMDKTGIILQNKFLCNTKQKFAPDEYSKVHQKYHTAISAFINTYEVYDLFLVEDRSGMIVYSVSKEIDFGTSLLNGPYSDTNLGKLYRQIRHTGLKNETIQCDFERYLPSGLAPAAFIAAPIFNENKKIGTMIIQIPITKVDEITTSGKVWENEGLGKTGETYIVGPDMKMRTDSRFMIENPGKYVKDLSSTGLYTSEELNWMKKYRTCILFQRIQSEGIIKGLSKISGTQQVKDYRNVEVLSSFAPLKVKNLQWVIVSEIDSEEIIGTIRKGAFQSIFLLINFMLVLVVIAIWFAHSLYKPILKLVEFAKELGRGRYSTQIPVNRTDELGLLMNTLNETAQQLNTTTKEITEKKQLLEKQQAELIEKTQNLETLNVEVLEINKRLDQMVRERTAKLSLQNEKIINYARINSHKLRAPVASILGLLYLIKASDKDKEMCLNLLEIAVKQLDDVVYEIQDVLDKEQDFID